MDNWIELLKDLREGESITITAHPRTSADGYVRFTRKHGDAKSSWSRVWQCYLGSGEYDRAHVELSMAAARLISAGDEMRRKSEPSGSGQC